MHLSHILPFFAGLAAALPTNEPFDRREPAPGPSSQEVQIAGIVFAGSGCPAGSASGQFSSDPTTLILPHATLVAQSGKNISVVNHRTNCQINVKVKYPSGWQFSVSKADYSGYAQIPVGTTGVSKSTYYFSGERAEVSSNSTIIGPYDNDYLRTDQFDVTNTVWSPCGLEGLLNINSQVRLSLLNSSQTALITVNTLEKLDISWRRCSRAPPNPETPGGPSQEALRCPSVLLRL